MPQEPPPILSLTQSLHGNMSPRKQALKRHEDIIKQEAQSIFNEAKRNMKPTSCSSAGTDVSLGNGNLLSSLKFEEKTMLTEIAHSHILVYHDLHQKSLEKTISGNLLARGALKIFQLHNGDVTYMSCGESFVYPLMPKLNLLRTDKNTFILPLANPRRYWKIVLENTDRSHLLELEAVLQNVVKYTNLWSDNLSLQLLRHDEHPSTPDSRAAADKLLSLIFNELPPSPPSVSASPPCSPKNMHTIALNSKMIIPPPEFLSNVFESPHHEKFYPPNLNTYEPHLSNQKVVNDAGDDSSMDSLLDEYEETLSVTKTMSRQNSISHFPSLVNGNDQFESLNYRTIHPIPSHKFRSDAQSVDHGWSNSQRLNENLLARRMNMSQGARSRKSSTSDLYTSVSNWMEPGRQPNNNKVPHSKSMRSMASRQSLAVSNTLLDAYREIPAAEKHSSVLSTHLHGTKSKNYHVQTSKALAAMTPKVETVSHPHKNDGLTPSEVYDLIRNRDNTTRPKTSGIRSFFGW